MKDSRGRTIRKGDHLVYGTVSRPHSINAALVTEIRPTFVKVRIISHTQYGTAFGKDVSLGLRRDGLPLTNVMVIRSGGRSVNFEEKRVRRFDEKGR